MTFWADVGKGAAPAGGKETGSFQADIEVIRAGYHQGWKGEGGKRHGCEAAGAGWIIGGFHIAGTHQEGSLDSTTLFSCPVCDGAASQAMCDQDRRLGGKGGKHLIDGLDPVFTNGLIPISLLDPDKTI